MVNDQIISKFGSHDLQEKDKTKKRERLRSCHHYSSPALSRGL
jgi:hypothetical protein